MQISQHPQYKIIRETQPGPGRMLSMCIHIANDCQCQASYVEAVIRKDTK